MVRVSLAALATAAAVPLVSAVDISVKATGGNATSPHQYGFLHEVRTHPLSFNIPRDSSANASSQNIGHQQLWGWRFIRRTDPQPGFPVEQQLQLDLGRVVAGQ